jgi:hypothetical protein
MVECRVREVPDCCDKGLWFAVETSNPVEYSGMNQLLRGIARFNGMVDADSPRADQIDRVEIAVAGNLIVARLYHSSAGLSFLAQLPHSSPVPTISE